MRKIFILWLFGAWVQQTAGQVVWNDPMEAGDPLLWGQCWQDELCGSYARLSERIRPQVRPALWELSTHSAGLFLRFQTDASVIRVRYGVDGSTAMPHMPATGVSGVDLYVAGKDEKWHFAARNIDWVFSDTVKFDFRGSAAAFPEGENEYMLYLPLYNRLNWLEVGVDSSAGFRWIPPHDDRLPIVAYGTSILQGGCASRPGMAWTNILSRKLGCTVMNFGFSGNGQMDPEVVAQLAEIDTRLYLIDCIANMLSMDDSTFIARFRQGVASLRGRSDAPILLAEYAGGINAYSDPRAAAKNALLRRCYDDLRAEGVRGLYYLAAVEVAFPDEGTVDGVHPNDLGMDAVAVGYERKIRRIFHKGMKRAAFGQDKFSRK